MMSRRGPHEMIATTDTLLRELNHRVNNNFQVVVSLMNLKKRVLPPERHDDIRFIEEHVHAMAASYRLIHADGGRLVVPAKSLIDDVVLGLRLLAQLPPELFESDLALGGQTLDLDQAIALSLYIAVILPPYLDHGAREQLGVRITAQLRGEEMILTVTGAWAEVMPIDVLRERLMVAYVTRLSAAQLSGAAPAHRRLAFAVTPPETP